MATLDDFDIHVISLPQREDRRRALRRQFESHGIDWTRVTVFAAVRPAEAAGFPTVGAHGCFLSHLAVLRSQIGARRPTLVCEDDLDFSADFAARIGATLETLRRSPWDIMFFGAHLCGQPMENLDVRKPDAKLSHLHMVAYQPSVVARIVDYLEAVRLRPPGDPLGPMHVDDAVAFFRRDNPDVVTRVAVPSLGVQRASPSDIQQLGWHDRHALVRPVARLYRWGKNRLRSFGLWRERTF